MAPAAHKTRIVMDTSWWPDFATYEGPKFRALAAALAQAARSGSMSPGTRLPAVRDLAWRLGVTPGTVARAYQIAAAEGVIDSHVGRGSFIACPRPRIAHLTPMLSDRVDDGLFGPDPAPDGPVDLRLPQLPECGQTAAISAAMVRAAATLGREVLDYPPLGRDRDCRAAVAGWLAGRGMTGIGPEDIALAHGGQNAVQIVMALCLTGERPRLLCEHLAYPGLRHAARLLRAEPTPVPIDAGGMIPEALDRVVRQTGARVVCVTASAQNPTAARMDAERRAAIAQVARHHDLQVIDDDCPAGTARDPVGTPPLRAFAPERVWHVSSLSKILSAGLRLGFIICPPGMGEAARLAGQHSFFGMPLPMTALVTELLTGGEAAQLAEAVHEVFEDRTHLAQAILGHAGLVSQPGVPFVWLRLPPGWRGSAFVARAAERGVLIRAADEFATGGGAVPDAVRIALPGRMDRERLADALRMIARLLETPPGEMAV